MVEICHWVIRLWWAKVAGTVRSSTVVVADVLGEHRMQVPLTKDQHAVGAFCSEGAHEPFGEAVRSRVTRRNPHHVDTGVGQDSI